MSICFWVEANTLENDSSYIIEKVERSMDAFYRMDFKKSENIIDEAIKDNPNEPLLYLIKGGFYLEKFRFNKGSNEAQNQELKEKILSLNNKVIKLAKQQIKSDPQNMNAYYLLGAAHGNIGRYYLKNGQWLKGFWLGKKGFKFCKKVVSNDPENYNAYLGVGLFHYFSATVPKVVKVLSFLLGAPEGDRERGIKEVELVRDNSRILSVEARRILLRIARWEKNWDKFYSGSKWLAEHYQENIYFQIFYMYGLSHNNKFADAQDQQNKVIKLIKNDPSQLPATVQIKYFRYSGYLNFHLENYPQAIKYYLDAIDLSKTVRLLKKIWAEDYYYLAASYAKLGKKDEALQYLNIAIDNGWSKESVIEQDGWKPFITDKDFIKIIKG